jgi:hypothetical protein
LHKSLSDNAFFVPTVRDGFGFASLQSDEIYGKQPLLAK